MKGLLFYKMDIFLNNDIIKDKNLTDEAFTAYTALRILHRQGIDKYCVNTTILITQLTGSLTMSRRYTDKLSKGLKELIEKNIVSVVENKGINYILDISNLYIDSNSKTDGVFFAIVTLEEVRKIFTLSKQVDRFSILRYFVAMISTFDLKAECLMYEGIVNRKGFIGYMPMNYIGSLCQITSRNTIHRYNIQLEEMKIIYIYRNPDLLHDMNTGVFRNVVNHYGRYRDKDLIDEYASRRAVFEGLTVSSVEKANHNRSLMMKYRHLCSGKTYSKKEIKEIYRYIHYYNTSKRKEAENTEYKSEKESILAKIKDESVFKQFPYLFKGKKNIELISDEQWGEPDSIDGDNTLMENNGNMSNEYDSDT